MLRLIPGVVGSLCVVGCFAAATPNLDTLRTRAAFDLNCPKKDLELVKLSSEVYGVTGCERRASYMNSPSSYNEWIMNSDSTKEEPGQSK